MRTLVAAALTLVPLLAGCLAPAGPQAAGPAPLELASIAVPEGASLEAIAGGARLLWKNITLPLAQELVIPRGTTMVRLSAQVDEGETLGVSLAHAETGRRRCNVPSMVRWFQPTTGTMTCTGLTAVDTLPTKWRAVVTQPAAAAGGPLDPPPPAQVASWAAVEYLTTPLDGLMASLDLAQLSMPDHELEPTQSMFIPSFDGTPLYAEVTLPRGEGPWPVIISSSPYNGPFHLAGRLAMWDYFVHDWAMRGYAVINADVRGFAKSGGCVEVWGTAEQKDQVALVEWAAGQPWSNGNVGFYGQSYVGTTPVEAAVQAPEALKAIVAVAPVINSYFDWHFGGVPNGEQTDSMVAYQWDIGTVEKVDPRNDPATLARTATNGLCDPTLVVRSNDPRSVYDSFYEERNFSARAGDVKAAVLYTQGFEDSNVKSAMIPHWFNALQSPKLGLFGHWIHQHPIRADQEVLFLAWMDQYVKGKPMGLEKLPVVDVVTNADTHHSASEWPPEAPVWRAFGADFTRGGLSDGAGAGQAQLWLQAQGPETVPVVGDALAGALTTQVALESAPLEQAVHFAGEARLHLQGSLRGADNAYVAAFLHDIGPDGTDTVATWGMANLAHRFGHETYQPVMPGATFTMDLPFLPTEYVVLPGHALRLVVRAAHTDDWDAVDPTKPGFLTLTGDAEGTALQLPIVAEDGVGALPATAMP